MRTLIIEMPSAKGNFAKVATAISNAIGVIKTIKIGTLSTLQDITVHCESEKILAEVIEAVSAINGGISVYA